MALIKICAFFMMFLMIILCVNRLLKKDFKIAYIMIIVFYSIMGIQPFLELFIEQVEYNNIIYFEKSYNDVLTNYIFYFLLILIPLIFWFFGRDKKKIQPLKQGMTKQYAPLLLVIALLPIVLVLFSNNISYYLEYGFFQKNKVLLETEIVDYYNLVYVSTFISVVSLFFYMYLKKITVIRCLMFISIFTLDVIFNNKRMIVLIGIVLIFLLIYFKIKIKRSIYFVIGILLVLIYFTYNSFYLNQVKSATSELNYDIARILIDFSRAPHLKMEIYCWIYNDPILDYHGQSILFNLLLFIPRNMMSMKPYPYAVYFTNKALNLNTFKILGWGYTTNIYGEMISNFGFVGLLFFLIVLTKIFKKIDKLDNTIIRLYSIFLLTMLSMLQFSAISFLIYIFLAYLIFNKIRSTVKFVI